MDDGRVSITVFGADGHVYGFVNVKHVADAPSSEAILRRWKEAGHLLGNHTYSHANLNRMSLSEYLTDLEKGEEVLKRLEPDSGVWKVFRYPFLFEGDTSEKRDGVRQYLREHDLAIPAHDMSIEAMTTKLAWLLGQQLDYETIKKQMVEDLHGEINIINELI